MGRVSKCSSSLRETLHVLQMARSKLIFDFISKEQDIYTSMFSYEGRPALMEVAIGRYFTLWVCYHFNIWGKYYPDCSRELFLRVMKGFLLKTLDKSEKEILCDESFLLESTHSKIKLLDEIIGYGEKDNKNYKELLLMYVKDNALFEREFRKLRGES